MTDLPQQTTNTETPLARHERRCIATGIDLPKNQLLRFVLSPEHVVTFDAAHKLPGRGLWLTPQKDALALAMRKNLFAKSAKASAIVPADLPTQIEQQLTRRFLQLLSLARKAGMVLAGFDQVEAALRAQKATQRAALVLVAADAAYDGQRKLYGLAKGAGIGWHKSLSRHELGQALGREEAVFVALLPSGLTTNIEELMGFLTALRGEEADKTALSQQAID